MKNQQESFDKNEGSIIKEHPSVDIQKLEESIDNMQDQLKMLDRSRTKIAERLIVYQGLYYSLSHKLK